MEDNSLQTNSSTQLTRGLITDSAYNNSPDGSWTYALNLINETKQGSKGYIGNEYGNSSCISLDIDGKSYKVVGSINLLEEEVVLFLATADQSESRIVIQSGCNLVNVVYPIGANSSSCLNFSEYHPITGVAKIRKGCNRVIYFRDSYNSDKSIDLDEILNSPDDNRYYNTTDGWNCGLFKLSPNFDFPKINYVNTSDAGGNLKLGVYQFGVALGDEDLNFTAVLDVTLPIPIVKGALAGNTDLIQGGDPLKENSPTTKSITINLTNLDQDYEYMKLYVIETISGVTTAYVVDTFNITNTSFQYTYGGLDYNSATVVSLADINANVLVYDKSKSMEQQDQRLLRANLEERTVDYTALQIAANKIKTRYVTTPRKYSSNTSVFSGNYYVDKKSYMRDEVYALGISAVFTDGTETAEVHIPGRVLDTATEIIASTGSTQLPLNFDPFNITGTKEHNRKTPTNGWDSTEYTITGCTTQANVSGISVDWTYPLNHGVYADLPANEVSSEDAKALNKNIGDSVKRWELYNTAYRTELYPLNGVDNQPYYSKGQMAYWESLYTYPDTVSCSGERIFPEGKIRHHKFPDTTLEPHFMYDANYTHENFIITMGLEFDLTDFITELQSRLGSVFNEIQGFKIARVKRDKNNKSVLDKGIAYRALEMKYDAGGSTSSDWRNYILQNNFYNKHFNVGRFQPGIPFASLEGRSFIDYFNTDNVLPDFESFDSGQKYHQQADFKYSTQYISIHNPKAQFLNESNFQFIKCEKELYAEPESFSDISSWSKDQKSSVSFYLEFKNNLAASGFYGTPLPYFTNRLRSDEFLQPANFNSNFDGKQLIGKTQQDVYLGKIDNYPDISNNGVAYTFYGGSPSKDLDGSTFTWTPSGGKIKFYIYDTYGSYVGATPGVEHTVRGYYISLKNYNPGIYNQLASLTYYPIHSGLLPTNTTTVDLFGGDIFISQMQFRTTNTDVVPVADDEKTWFACYTNYFVESEINCKLRNEGYSDTDYASWYYPIHSKTDVLTQNDFKKIGASNIGDVVQGYLDGNYCFNTYNYNKDYSKAIDLKPKFPLALGYDYCSRCLNKYPYRIVFSEKSYQEDRTDSYRKILANSYRDISASTGEIFNLLRESDTLFVRTTQSLWYIPTKQQEMKTDAGTIQIGTGEFFSLPPKELVSTTIGYNGGQTTLDLVVNEYGAIYADANAGIVFLTKVGKGQQEISKEAGNRFWFEENLPFALLDHSPFFPDSDAPTGKAGIGLVGYYDPQYRRYILTKKDYYPIYPDTSVYIDNTHEWLVNGTTIITDPYNSPSYFENRSWTISYSLEENMWLSWHSYLPNYAWNTRNNFFTSIQGNNNTWRHGNGEFQTFYGVKYPHIFEFVSNKEPLQTKISNTLSYISNVQEWDSSKKQWLDIKGDTFNKGIFYNDTQSTGELDIFVKNNNDPFASVLTPFDPGAIFSERTESNWNISNIRDMVDQTNPEQPLFASDWNSIKNSYYTDKVPNGSILNYLTKPQYEMEELRDNFMVCRLSYKNALNNRRIITKYISTNSNFSIR